MTTQEIKSAVGIAIGPNAIRIPGATSGQTLVHNGTEFVPSTPVGGPPSGAAGGELAGSYPNPTLATTQPSAHSWTLAQTYVAGLAGPTGASLFLYSGSTFVAQADKNGAFCVGAYPNVAQPTVPGLCNASLAFSLNDPTTGQYVPAVQWFGTTVLQFGAGGGYGARLHAGTTIEISAGTTLTVKQQGLVRTTTSDATGTITTDGLHSAYELTAASTTVNLDDGTSVTDAEFTLWDRTGTLATAPHLLVPNNSKLVDGLKGTIWTTGGLLRVRKGSDGNWYTSGNEALIWPPETPTTRDFFDPEQNVVGTTWGGAKRGTPLTGSPFPTYSTAISGANGHGALTFDGSTMLVKSPSTYLSFNMSQAVSITVGGKFRPTGTNGVIVDGNGLQIYMNSTAGTGMSAYAGSIINSSIIPAGTVEIWTVVITGTATLFYRDGTLVFTGASAGVTTGFSLGIGAEINATLYSAMDLFWAQMDGGSLTAAQVLHLHRMLGKRFAHTVA